MPRKKLPPRLVWREDGQQWVIRDGQTYIRTGQGREGHSEALRQLAEYIDDGRPRGPSQPGEITVGEVLALYLDEHGPLVVDRQRLIYAAKAMLPFWANLKVDAVKGSTARRYVREREAAPSTARRELGMLQAALNYAHGEGVLIHPVKVPLPPKSPPRDRWLTRGEAARLIRAASPHLRRVILIALATGTRTNAILALRWGPSLDSGWVDLKAGVLHRRGARETDTKKRRGSVRIPRRLLSHMHRWARKGGSHVVMTGGKPVGSVKKAFARACERSGVERATPHDLKRTAVTWAFQEGMTREDATDWFDTTADTLEAVYRKHSPDHQSRALRIMEKL
ncbi:MAG: site-specific integrase [Pseudomonadota bacterium]